MVRITWYERPNELSHLQYTLPYEIELKTLIYRYIFWKVSDNARLNQNVGELQKNVKRERPELVST